MFVNQSMFTVYYFQSLIHLHTLFLSLRLSLTTLLVIKFVKRSTRKFMRKICKHHKMSIAFVHSLSIPSVSHSLHTIAIIYELLIFTRSKQRLCSTRNHSNNTPYTLVRIQTVFFFISSDSLWITHNYIIIQCFLFFVFSVFCCCCHFCLVLLLLVFIELLRF